MPMLPPPNKMPMSPTMDMEEIMPSSRMPMMPSETMSMMMEQETMFMWSSLISNPWEIIAFLTAIIYIILLIYQRSSCWYYGIVSSVIYIYLFIEVHLYVRVLLNGYCVLMYTYGWLLWTHRWDTLVQKLLPNKKLLCHVH